MELQRVTNIIKFQESLPYTVVEQRVTWSEAKTYCEAWGGRLAQPHSQKEHDRIKSKLSNINEFRQYWFGLRKEVNGWQYTDGSTVGFSSWGPGRDNRFILLIILKKYFENVFFNILKMG